MEPYRGSCFDSPSWIALTDLPDIFGIFHNSSRRIARHRLSVSKCSPHSLNSSCFLSHIKPTNFESQWRNEDIALSLPHLDSICRTASKWTLSGIAITSNNCWQCWHNSFSSEVTDEMFEGEVCRSWTANWCWCSRMRVKASMWPHRALMWLAVWPLSSAEKLLRKSSSYPSSVDQRAKTFRCIRIRS